METNNAQEKILEKVRKLLALSESPNQAEAEAAFRKAHALLKEYNLDMDSVELKNIDLVDEEFLEGGKIRAWKKALLQSIAKVNYCGLYSNTVKQGYVNVRHTSTTTLNIVGKPHNVAGTKVMAEYLFETIDRMAQNYEVRGKGEIESYKLGIAVGLMAVLKEMMMQDIVEVGTRDLVISEGAAIREYFDDMNTHTTKIKAPTIADPNAYAHGIIDSKKINLHQQIGERDHDRSTLTGVLEG